MIHYILDTNVLLKLGAAFPVVNSKTTKVIIPKPVIEQLKSVTPRISNFEKKFSNLQSKLLENSVSAYSSSNIPLEEIIRSSGEHDVVDTLISYTAKDYQDNVVIDGDEVVFVTDDKKFASRIRKQKLLHKVISIHQWVEQFPSQQKAIDTSVDYQEIDRYSQLEAELSALKEVISNISTQLGKNEQVHKSLYVDHSRLTELKDVSSNDFDLSRLICLCEELNKVYSGGCYLSTAMLLRAVIDHIPPIFGLTSFNQVANNYSAGSKSFKDHANNLNGILRKISDSYLHTHIRNKESLPSKIQVDFSPSLDFLLSEVVRVLK